MSVESASMQVICRLYWIALFHTCSVAYTSLLLLKSSEYLLYLFPDECCIVDLHVIVHKAAYEEKLLTVLCLFVYYWFSNE